MQQDHRQETALLLQQYPNVPAPNIYFALRKPLGLTVDEQCTQSTRQVYTDKTAYVDKARAGSGSTLMPGSRVSLKPAMLACAEIAKLAADNISLELKKWSCLRGKGYLEQYPAYCLQDTDYLCRATPCHVSVEQLCASVSWCFVAPCRYALPVLFSFTAAPEKQPSGLTAVFPPLCLFSH